MIRVVVIYIVMSVSVIALAAERVINIGTAPPRYKGVVKVDDPDATGGVAYQTTKGVSGAVAFAYSWGELMGIYEARFRLKVADNTIKEPVVNVRYNCETVRYSKQPKGVVSSKRLKGTDFKQANVYQDIVVRWLGPHRGRMGWAVAVTGKGVVTFDSIRVSKVKSVTEEELLTYMPGGGVVPTPWARQGPHRAHLVRGMFSDFYMLDLALPRLNGLRLQSGSYGSNGGVIRTPEALYDQDLLILAGTDIAFLSLRQRVAIDKWVRAGGGLFILGGPRSFAQAGMKHSIIERLLPLTVKSKFDLERKPIMISINPASTSHPIAKGLSFNPPMAAVFRHRVDLSKTATVVLGTNDAPLLVVGQTGKGRVACFLAPPMGRDDEAGEGTTPFWNDARFPQIITNTCRWLITRKSVANPYAWVANRTPRADAEALIDSLDTDGLEGDDDDDDDAVDELKLSKTELHLLCTAGGAAAKSHLLKAMPDQIDPLAILKIERAVRPFIAKSDWETVDALSRHMRGDVKLSGLALLGKADPQQASGPISKILRGNPEGDLLRSAVRSVGDGQIASQRAELKRLYPILKAQVNDLEARHYEGYWFNGVDRGDPLLSYTECMMALLRMGETGLLQDACDLMLTLHIQQIKIRSFIFLYNPKVPREAKAAEMHRARNQFVGPDIEELLVRLERTLATLPPALHDEFRKALLNVDDFEKLQRLMYPAFAHIYSDKTGKWTSYRSTLEAHAFKLALSAKRL
jgi:hypothetical protein